MLIYYWKCSDCQKAFETSYDGGSDKPREGKCPSCNSKNTSWHTIKIRHGEPIRSTGEHIVWSESLGINPEQIAEAVKLHPDEVYDERGRMQFRSNKHREQMCKRYGFTVI